MKMGFIALFLVLFSLLSTAYADEPLMWISQDTPMIYSSKEFKENSPVYSDPQQYVVGLTPMRVPSSLDNLFSKMYGRVSINRENNAMLLTSSHEYFENHISRIAVNDICGIDDLPPDTCLSNGTPIVEQLKNELITLGWSTVADPDLFCTVEQAVNRARRPDIIHTFYAGAIPMENWSEIYYLHFSQEIEGKPMAIWIENANEEEYETRDASFVLDKNGKIITASIFPGYHVINKTRINAKLLTAFEAGERFLRIMYDRYKWTETNWLLKEYKYTWRIRNFRQGLVLTHDGVALPAWMIDYEQIMTHKSTGTEYYGYATYTINALTGAG